MVHKYAFRIAQCAKLQLVVPVMLNSSLKLVRLYLMQISIHLFFSHAQMDVALWMAYVWRLSSARALFLRLVVLAFSALDQNKKHLIMLKSHSSYTARFVQLAQLCVSMDSADPMSMTVLKIQHVQPQLPFSAKTVRVRHQRSLVQGLTWLFISKCNLVTKTRANLNYYVHRTCSHVQTHNNSVQLFQPAHLVLSNAMNLSVSTL